MLSGLLLNTKKSRKAAFVYNMSQGFVVVIDNRKRMQKQRKKEEKQLRILFLDVAFHGAVEEISAILKEVRSCPPKDSMKDVDELAPLQMSPSHNTGIFDAI